MKFCILLSCFDKVDDLRVNTEIIKYNKYGPKIIIAYMHSDQPPEEIKNFDVISFPSPGFSTGPLLSLTKGIIRANELGMDYLVFRNADDWLFNHDLQKSWLDQMIENDLVVAGYNWFGINSFHNIAMNENIFHVPTFMKTVKEIEEYFLIKKHRTCEQNLAEWLKATKTTNKFFRLPYREKDPGIGYEDIQEGDNQRFFNKKWQLIGSHYNQQRLYYWHQIRESVPYYKDLERSREFNRWLIAVKNKEQWNKQELNISRMSNAFSVSTNDIKKIKKKLL